MAGVEEGEVKGETRTESAFYDAEEETGCHYAGPGCCGGLEGCDEAPEEDYCCCIAVRFEDFPKDGEPFE